jgi:tetratricopeptide (TPR) repeat protein
VGKFKEAIGFIKKAIRIDPKHPGWYLEPLGWAYYFTGHHEENIAASKKLISLEPSNANAHALLGCALIAAGKPEEAVAIFEKALSMNPDRPVWCSCQLSIARLGAGQPEEAITMLRELLSRNPENAEVCSSMALLLPHEGKYEESLSMAKRAVSLEEMNPSPTSTAVFYAILGRSYRITGRYEEAIAALKKATSLWPDYLDAHIGLTASYSLTGREEDARTEAAEVVRINPKITLEDIAKNGYFWYKRVDKERHINALRKAGLPG